MGGLHKKVKKVRKYFEPHLAAAEKTFGKEKTDKFFDETHPMGTQMEQQYDATKAAERAATEMANKPVIPLPDEEEIKRNKRRGSGGSGRAATILTGGDRDRLGP